MEFSFQLYSARNFLPWDGVLKRIAELGYTQVEGFGGVFEDARSFRALMDKNGLSMPTAHISVDQLENDLDGVERIADTLGIQSIFCPYLDADDRPVDHAGWVRFADRLSAVNERVKATGRRFGWHNHDFEFVPMADGTIPQQTILDAAPDIDWEADIAWIIRGGGNPMDWIERHGNRITAVHVKDIAPEGACVDEDGWADVGHGTVDWPALIAALKSKSRTSYFVMEHDNPSDFDRFASRSIMALTNLQEA
ncbi:MAG: sugar phosphate isomerase/epimerase [Alphaproteobacteria bacterium]|nr:sugar phosphate isomerase/epimerase [Alphaproteobacteria bacterium]